MGTSRQNISKMMCIYALESRDAHLEREIAEVEHRPEPIELVLIEVRALAIVRAHGQRMQIPRRGHRN